MPRVNLISDFICFYCQGEEVVICWYSRNQNYCHAFLVAICKKQMQIQRSFDDLEEKFRRWETEAELEQMKRDMGK